MNFIIDDALTAIERERPELAGWCEDKRHELPDQGKLEALRWWCSAWTSGTGPLQPRRWALP